MHHQGSCTHGVGSRFSKIAPDRDHVGYRTDRRFAQNGKWTADGRRSWKASEIRITGLNSLKSNPFGRAGGSLSDQLERRVRLTDGGKPTKTEPSPTDHRFPSFIDRRLHRVQSGAIRRDPQPSTSASLPASVDLGSLVRELLQQTRPQPAHAHPKPQHSKTHQKIQFQE
ncbi:hypothetical protein AAVH_01693 [Aphelenchoides avenae]|nr:hypothetical protein AAVH_01693 [Aphelenchus avenae]